jgi:hypothetical protein
MHFPPTIFKHPNKLHHHYRTHTFVVEESSICSNKWAGTKTKPNPQTKTRTSEETLTTTKTTTTQHKRLELKPKRPVHMRF